MQGTVRGMQEVDSTGCVRGGVGDRTWLAVAVSGGSRSRRAQSSVTRRAASLGGVETGFIRARSGTGPSWITVLVCPGGHNKVPQAGSLNERFILSWLWRLEVQDQGLVASEPLSLARGWLSSPCVLTSSSLYMGLCPNFLFL